MPAQAGFTLTTKQGSTVKIRLLQQDDTEYLIDLFDHLSAESRYHRFHRPLEHPSLEQVRQGAEQLAQIGPEMGFALLGFAEVAGAAAPIAVARYVRLNECQAEPALTIRDDFQGQSIGRQLFARLIAVAQTDGIRQFVATVQPSNHAAVRLVQNAGYPYTQEVSDGQITLIVELTPSLQKPTPYSNAGSPMRVSTY